MGTRTHPWITVMAVAMLSLTAASCAMPEPIPLADSGPTFGDGSKVGIDMMDQKDVPLPANPDLEGGLDSGVTSDGLGDGRWRDGVKPDGVKPDGVKLDGVKQDGLTLDGPKKKLDGQKKPDGKP